MIIDTTTTKDNTYELSPTKKIKLNDDLNAYTDFGNWICHSAAVAKTLKNCPVTDQGFSLRLMRGTSGAYRVQDIITGLGIHMYRIYTGTSWSKWTTEADAAISQTTIKMFADAGYPIT